MRILRVIATTLVVVGAMVTLATSVIVYNGWRVAVHAGSYRPASFQVLDVSYSKGRKGSSLTGRGIIDGKEERIGFPDFVQNVHSQQDLERAVPSNSVLDVWYDPSAADVMTQGRYLRLLPRSYDLEHATAIATKRTLLCNSATILGALLLLIVKQSEAKQLAEESGRNVEGKEIGRLAKN